MKPNPTAKVMTTTQPNMRNLPVRAVSIENIDHPEWGTFGVYEDNGMWYDIHGQGGARILSKDEAAKFWRVKQ